MCLVSADLVAGPLDVAQNALGAFEQLLTAFGQPNAAIGAREQSDVELLFQPLDVPGESGLRNMQVRRGAGDAAELGDTDEVVQATQFHPAAISPIPSTPRQPKFGCCFHADTA